MTTLLVFDTASESMTIGLMHEGRSWSHAGAGGAKASAALIPAILALLAEADIPLDAVDAIGFGRGPGAFTGLRTACSVAQGLAFGAAKPVIPIDNLLCVAASARAGRDPFRVWATIDARMDQIYAAEYLCVADRWQVLQEPMLTDCEELGERWQREPPDAVAGDALRVFGSRLQTGQAERLADARIDAPTLLELAARAWRDGQCVAAAAALPLYVRDKVAETTLEREARR
ncbi:MAG: tRNA (adenosine(37)-N6)-threonylcarbamoyltransferase complex dimerization subunit type 1 TsaB [Pseudomonadota bacterium]|nr:tRNA (adenosine(37)-N6)-threonylcarbamoyltransferase complex dimerization subunit type 1 TsaB [Pseudomonadota bacterium]